MPAVIKFGTLLICTFATIGVATNAKAACTDLRVSGFDSKIGGTAVKNIQTFTNPLKSATVAIRCGSNHQSEAEALNEFRLIGDVKSVGPHIYRAENNLAGIRTINFLKVGTEIYSISLLTADHINKLDSSDLESKIAAALATIR